MPISNICSTGIVVAFAVYLNTLTFQSFPLSNLSVKNVAIPPTDVTVFCVSTPFSITPTVTTIGVAVYKFPPPLGAVLICIIGCVVMFVSLSTKPAAGCCI